MLTGQRPSMLCAFVLTALQPPCIAVPGVGPASVASYTMGVLGPRLGSDSAMLPGVIFSDVVIFAYGQDMF